MPSHTSSKEARNKAVTKYVKENYDRVSLRFTKESNLKQVIQEHIVKTGESVTSFIIRAIKETIENDNKKTQ
jgi:hypothetical protein